MNYVGRVCGYCGWPWRGGWGFALPATLDRPAIDEKFCGRACLERWEQGMNFTPDELRVIEAMPPELGQWLASQGLVDKSFADMSREQILGLLANTLRIYRSKFDELIDVPF